MKKWIAIALVSLMTLSLSPAAFAADDKMLGRDKEATINTESSATDGAKTTISQFDSTVKNPAPAAPTAGTIAYRQANGANVLASGSTIDVGTLAPGDVHGAGVANAVYLMTYDTSAKKYTTLSKTQSTNSKLSIKANYDKRYVKNVSLAYDSKNQAYVRFEMVNPYVSINSRSWKISLRLYQNKTMVKGSDLTIQGYIENETQDVYSGDDYLYADDAPVFNVQGNVSNATVELDYGVTLYTRFYNGRTYYASGYDAISSSDESVINKYPAINVIYTLNGINLSTASQVSFSKSLGDYVYDKDLKYLGRTGEKLAFSTKYYVTAERLSGTGASSGSSSSSSSSSSSTTVKETSAQKSVRQLFEKYYSNKIRAGDPVDVSGLNSKNLVFYRYDSKTNKFYKLSSPSFRIDGNTLTYLGSYTGTLVVSEGALKKK